MGKVVVDCETNSGAISGILTSVNMIGVYNLDYDEFSYLDKETLKDRDTSRYLLKEFIANDTPIFHNGLFDTWVIREWLGISIDSWIDTMVMSYNYLPASGHSLESWGNFLNYPKLEIENYDTATEEELAVYCKNDCMLTALIYRFLNNKVPPIYSIDSEFLLLIREMEYNGVKINTNAFDTIISEVNKKLISIEEEIFSIAPIALGNQTLTTNLRKEFVRQDTPYSELSVGQYVYLGETEDCKFKWSKVVPFNPGSSDHIAYVLKQVYDWCPTKVSHKTGKPTTDRETLSELDYPIIHALLDYSELAKLRSTYGLRLKEQISPDLRLRTSYNPCVTLTGRLSSSRPNLQNIPAKGEYGEQFRNLFVADVDAGKSLVGIDIDQFQLRILAFYMGYYSKEMPDMWVDFNTNVDADPHSVTAKLLFGNKFTKEQRKIAKTINFSSVFGAGAAKIAHKLKITIKEAQYLLKKFDEASPEIKQLKSLVVELAKKNDGCVYTLYGRKGRYQDMYSTDKAKSSKAERQAFNFLIQGTEADIIKLLMIHICRDLEYFGIKDKAQFVLQVHDEFVMEVENDYVDIVTQVIDNNINHKVWLPRMKLSGKATVGKKWGELK